MTLVSALPILIVAIVVAALAVGVAAWALWIVVDERRRRRDEKPRATPPSMSDDDAQRLQDRVSKIAGLVDRTFGRVDRAMRKTFGSRGDIWETEFRVPPEGPPRRPPADDVPTIACPKCGQANRLPKGVVGAVCGACKERLVRAFN